jgi:hypothetical protein
VVNFVELLGLHVFILLFMPYFLFMNRIGLSGYFGIGPLWI